MKRSEINQIVNVAKDFFASQKFFLPVWADWKPADWKGTYTKCYEIVDNMLGWDITDFGSGDFSKRGLVLFTIRNGNYKKQDKMYCEKIMKVDENQETPLHFHWNKSEDIINRGGGNLVLELYKANEQEDLSHVDVVVSIDGVETTVKAGEPFILEPGSSICLRPWVYHRFYGEPGHGPVMVGEVSMVNDDNNDNRFYETLGRFPELKEDEEPVHLLVNDYSGYL
jgi:D-lyxose ketol-isomerase